MTTTTADMPIGAIAPWFGCNRLLGAEVGKALHGCSWVGVVFAGGMPELVHIAHPPAPNVGGPRTILVNDLHADVINLAHVAADLVLGPQLYRRCRRMLVHSIMLGELQERLKDARAADGSEFLFTRPGSSQAPSIKRERPNLDWAVEYFAAVWMARSGSAGTDGELDAGLAVRWEAGGGDPARRYINAVKSLMGWRRVLARCTFTCMDAFDFLEKVRLAWEKPTTEKGGGRGVYVDTPFPDVGGGYRHKFSIPAIRGVNSWRRARISSGRTRRGTR